MRVVIRKTYYLFADDAKIYTHVTKIKEAALLLHHIGKFLDWTERWLVTLNVNKGKVATFCNLRNFHDKIDANYRIRQVQLEIVSSIKDIGLIFLLI